MKIEEVDSVFFDQIHVLYAIAANNKKDPVRRVIWKTKLFSNEWKLKLKGKDEKEEIKKIKFNIKTLKVLTRNKNETLNKVNALYEHMLLQLNKNDIEY